MPPQKDSLASRYVAAPAQMAFKSWVPGPHDHVAGGDQRT